MPLTPSYGPPLLIEERWDYVPHTPPYISSGVRPAWYSEDVKPDRSRDRKPSGWLFPKPYSRRALRLGTPTGYWLYQDPQGNPLRVSRRGALSDQYGRNWRGPSNYNPNVADRALTKAQLAIKGQKINLGVAWAEAGKTADLVGSSARRIAGAFSALRKGNIKQAARLLGVDPKPTRKSVDPWLEYRYGWVPLMSDVYGSVEALANRELYEYMITGKGVIREQVDYQIDEDFSNYPCTTVGRGFDGAFVRLDFTPEDNALSKLNSLGLLNPAEIVWELIPYSFVVDWFLPIGDAISSIGYAAGMDFHSGSLSRRLSVVEELRSLPSSNPKISADVSGKSMLSRLDRTVYSSSPWPVLPAFRNPLSLKHMADGLSLLVKAFK